ncbi:MAG: RNA methyltransferase [Lentisphaerae bacterium]|jgi:23S rRNA (guanosine2251-2'-O)-methyltransferase|nr:RNA methyltransferase [Lentisphaerota bacterium]
MVIVRTGDRLDQELVSAQLPVVVILDRLRSAHNVGNIFRLVEAVCGEAIAACGYTACPPHEKLAKTAMGSDQLVTCNHYETSAQAILDYRARGYRIYGVETVENATLYCDVDIQFPCALVLGNEALGISDDALSLCDQFVCLPSRGRKNSINVGNCAAVVLYECLRQHQAASEIK